MCSSSGKRGRAAQRLASRASRRPSRRAAPRTRRRARAGRGSAGSRGRGSPPRPGVRGARRARARRTGRARRRSRRGSRGRARGARASPLLPERGDGSREADRDRAVEEADVDPELERVRRRHAEELALDEPPLDLAPLLGGVAGAVRGEPARGRGVDALGGEAVDQLGRLAALREADRPQPARRELGEEPRRVAERARAQAELGVEQRRVPDDDLALGAGGGVRVDDGRRLAGQLERELAGVRDRRRGEQELRLGVVDPREPPQPAQDVRDVRAEDAAVDVRLVDDDVAEVREDVSPAVVVREDADVEHVRVREDDVRPLADLPAPLGRRVAVVDRGPQPLEPELRERARLILRERLRRVEVERPRLRLAGDRVEDGEVERERLPRGRAGRDDDVLAALRRLPRLGLVSEERRDAGRDERGGDARIEVVRKRLERRLARGLEPPSTRSPRPRAGRPSWSRRARHRCGVNARSKRARGCAP